MGPRITKDMLGGILSEAGEFGPGLDKAIVRVAARPVRKLEQRNLALSK